MPEDESMQDSIDHRFEDALMTLRGQIDREAAANRAAGEAGEALGAVHDTPNKRKPLFSDEFREYIRGRVAEVGLDGLTTEERLEMMGEGHVPVRAISCTIPITEEMLEDVRYPFTVPTSIPDEVWARPTRLMRLRWQIRVARSRAHDAWLVLAGKAQIKDESDYDDWED